jgi:alkylation response protein AidB-like acyl-CoA dehydrogenase
MGDVVERARLIADEVLFPAAIETDRAPLVPRDHLDRLARGGFYGMAGPSEAGGWDLDPETANRVIESLASGCLSTTFVWLQHHNPVRAVARSRTAGLRDEWLMPLCRGDRRAGIALAGERPGPQLLKAERADGGLVLNGEAPWVTGWGLIDVVMVAARAGDEVVRGLVEAEPGPTLEVEPLRLVAANASGTVTVRFRDHVLPADRIVNTEPHADVLARDAASLRTNGSLALGVAERCRMLIGSGELDDEVAARRSELDAATPETLPAARARASELALRAAAALVVAEGARSILIERHAQRLAREALFLLVFGSRPAIRAALFDAIVRDRDAPPSLA